MRPLGAAARWDRPKLDADLMKAAPPAEQATVTHMGGTLSQSGIQFEFA